MSPLYAADAASVTPRSEVTPDTRPGERRLAESRGIASLTGAHGDTYSHFMTISAARLPSQVDPLIGEAKRRTRRRRLALAGAFLLVAIAVAPIAVKAAAGHSSPAPGLRTSPALYRALASSTGCTPGPRPAIGKFPGDTNHDGLISDSGSERVPALVAAVGDHGSAG